MNPRVYTNRDIDIIMDDAMHRAGVQHVSRHVIANSVRDNMGNTLAMCFARLGMIPSVKWGHDARLYNNNGYNVQAILFNRGIKDIPSWWKPIYKVLDNDGKRICVGCLEVQDKIVKTLCGCVYCVECAKWPIPNVCPSCDEVGFMQGK